MIKKLRPAVIASSVLWYVVTYVCTIIICCLFARTGLPQWCGLPVALSMITLGLIKSGGKE